MVIKVKYYKISILGFSPLYIPYIIYTYTIIIYFQTKYFDSGDYNMAKAKKATTGSKKPAEVKEVTGDHMPTPEEIPRVRKPSHSKLVMH